MSQEKLNQNPDLTAQSKKAMIKELSPLPKIDTFIGYNCRTYAIAGVMRWMHENGQISHAPLPARKMDFAGYFGLSLRKLAKQKHHSSTGEIYNIEDLAALAEENTDIHAKCVTCKNEDDYIKTIMSAIDAHHAPVIFFDVNNTGLPGKFNGTHEHSAVVVGYTIHPDNEVTFKIGQWEKYFDFNARELYQSSAQLLKERSGEDLYFKVKTRQKRFMGHYGWTPLKAVIDDKIDKDRIVKSRQAASPTSNGGYAGKILILEEKYRPELSSTQKKSNC